MAKYKLSLLNLFKNLIWSKLKLINKGYKVQTFGLDNKIL